MAQIVLALPDKFEYALETAVHIGEIHGDGCVGTAGVVSLMHDARIGFLNKLGYRENDIEGVAAVVTDSVVVFKSGAFHGDPLKIEVAAGDFSRCGCVLFYKIIHQRTKREIARARTSVLFFDQARKKKMEVPRKFRSIFVHEDQLELDDLFRDMDRKD